MPSVISKIDALDDSQAQIVLNRIEEQIKGLPDHMIQEWKQINKKPADYADVRSKLKLTIPIIPTILSYDTEISWDIRNALNAIVDSIGKGKYIL